MEEQRRKRSRRWRPADVLREITELSERSAKSASKHHPSLYGAAVRHFGSWRAAIEAAGISYPNVSKRNSPGFWTKEAIIAKIKELENKTSSYVRQYEGSLYNGALRLFGGWKEAIEASGINYDSIRKGWIPSPKKKPKS